MVREVHIGKVFAWLGIIVQFVLIILRIMCVIEWDMIWVLFPLLCIGAVVVISFIVMEIIIFIFSGMTH